MQLQVLGPAEGFVSYMRISLIAGLIVASPWVFYQLWMFVAAGLYPQERKYVYMTIPFSILLFIAGALFFMFVVAPLCLKFLVKFNEVILGATSAFTFQKYVGFVTTLMLVFGLAFQTPIAIVGLNKAGIVSLDALKRSRKYTMLGIVIMSAVVTPPDVISQITLSIPLYFLFELAILLCWLSQRKKKAAGDDRTG
jgi:sec-independent protein translocase protein TatC